MKLNFSIKTLKPKSFLIAFLMLFFFSVTIYLSFYKLGHAPFENWDEAWYAEVTRNILRNRNFIVLYWNGDPFFDKPPLFMWINAIIASFIGISEFSMRILSATSGAVLILLVTFYSYKNYGIIPSVLAYSAIALNNIYVWRMRSGNIDVFLSLLIFLTFLTLISRNKYKYIILGLLFAFIFLTKASIVIYPLSIFILHEIIFNRNKWKLLYKEYAKLFLITLIIPAIWLVLGFLKIGLSYPVYFLFNSDQSVAKVSIEYFNSNYILHTYYSLQRSFFFVFIIGFFFALKNIKDSKLFLLISYSIALLLLLSFTQKNNNWYLIPSIPFWAILIAYGTFNVIRIFKNNILILTIIISLSLIVSYKTLMVNILPILNTSSTIKTSESAKLLNKLTRKDDLIIRLDHLYPATIYYSDRLVKSSPPEVEISKNYWISRTDLNELIINRKVHWIVGTNGDIESFKKQLYKERVKTIKVNDEETVLKIN
jgi:4-amino-4-deoxy-L-arabinose transferase-like glycosyltransferase